MIYGDNHDELANSEQPQAQPTAAIQTVHPGTLPEARLSASSTRLSETPGALAPDELPIVLKLWAHDVPNSGVDTWGVPEEAAGIIKEMYAALDAATNRIRALCGPQSDDEQSRIVVLQGDAALALASADTRPEGGASTKIEAPFTSGAVPKAGAQ